MKNDKTKATKTGSAFRMDCAIRTTIHASPEKIWAFLTDLAAFPRWKRAAEAIA